ncbi:MULTISPECIES: PD-(D/E)XK nuclease-like domain-containing protein [Enterobacteriaceae]|uniref:PD-(D/E)XK nuclease-like domain-containing protein n=1 Tax=Enterobacteriaceae TaxID=543 RepID=UPI001FF172DD|nr:MULTISPECIES: PD-(D/E)XK nuclease-like domain-containing protein [Enterobacteriaceae]MDT9046472.1 PD-(D/E)XK nuclease-like domain-containing protein [Escherichia coli]UOV84383.1 PD-(D/E)XK nuclease-like domain-containing protein [Klebsiella pneumoniae]
MKPGVYDHLSNAEYHGGEGVSNSMLNVLREKSPMHLKALRDVANDNERPQPTVAQRIGTAFHMLVLEPHLFDESYVLPLVLPDDALSTIDDLKAALKDAGEKVSGTKPELIERLKAVRPDAKIADELKQQYAASNAGRTIITIEERDQLYAMRDAVMAHPAANALLTGAKYVTEVSAYATDPDTGELRRVRPDLWRFDGIVGDVKTTDDASPEGFARSIATWGYDVQHPYYLDTLNLALQQQVDCSVKHPTSARQFVFLVVEKKPPHAVAVYVLDAASVDLGRAKYRASLNTYAECKRTGVWPGYGDKVQTISLPQWHMRQNEHLLDSAA